MSDSRASPPYLEIATKAAIGAVAQAAMGDMLKNNRNGPLVARYRPNNNNNNIAPSQSSSSIEYSESAPTPQAVTHSKFNFLSENEEPGESNLNEYNPSESPQAQSLIAQNNQNLQINQRTSIIIDPEVRYPLLSKISSFTGIPRGVMVMIICGVLISITFFGVAQRTISSFFALFYPAFQSCALLDSTPVEVLSYNPDNEPRNDRSGNIAALRSPSPSPSASPLPRVFSDNPNSNSNVIDPNDRSRSPSPINSASIKNVYRLFLRRYRYWLTYWLVYAVFSGFESILSLDTLLSWVPFYYPLKVAGLIWFFHPSSHAATYIYSYFVEPVMAKHEPQIDSSLDTLGRAASISIERARSNSEALVHYVRKTSESWLTPSPGPSPSNDNIQKFPSPRGRERTRSTHNQKNPKLNVNIANVPANNNSDAISRTQSNPVYLPSTKKAN